MLRLRALILFGVLASPAWALDCHTGSQSHLNECAEQAFKAADSELNAVVKQMDNRLANAASPNAKSLLSAAQRDWIAFRDAECSFKASDSEGGSMHGFDVVQCRTALTQERIAELKSDLSCKSNDGDCPAGATP